MLQTDLRAASAAMLLGSLAIYRLNLPVKQLASTAERCIIHRPFVQHIVVGLHLPWEGVWQRPNHVLTRLSRHLPVTVVEEARRADTDRSIVRREGNVDIVTLDRVNPSDAIDDAALRFVRERVGTRRALVWLYTPMMLALADTFPQAPLVFDKMDELAAFASADSRIGERERQVLARADVTFTGGRSLDQTVRGRTKTARCYPSGVDVDHFEAARVVPPHAALEGMRSPVFGYIGVIDERLDLELIAAIARARPDATLALVGPTAKIDPATLPRARNIAYLGQRTYAELPSLLAGFDVALMPFAINDHTKRISPTKTLEYLAAGKPVVSTPVPDVIEDHADVVTIARGHEAFIEALRTARFDDARVERKLRTASWDAIVDAMMRDLSAHGVELEKERSPA